MQLLPLSSQCDNVVSDATFPARRMQSLGHPGEKMSIIIKNIFFIFECMSQIMEENSAVFLADLSFQISH